VSFKETFVTALSELEAQNALRMQLNCGNQGDD
jgi:hypothetical protein